MQQALDALTLECCDNDGNPVDLKQPAITALEVELGKPEQEPRKEWVGLTDKERIEIWRQHGSYETLFKKVEIKLKDKNT